jgi:hypothetical protein
MLRVKKEAFRAKLFFRDTTVSAVRGRKGGLF